MNSFFKYLDDNLIYIHIKLNMPVVLLQLKIVW